MVTHPWLQYKKWAVVGASTNPDRYGNKIVSRFKDKGYSPFPVSPKYQEVEGLKAFTSLYKIPENIDVVNFVVKPSIGLKVLDACIKLGIKHIWLQPGTVSDELVEKAESNGIEVVEACTLVALSYL